MDEHARARRRGRDASGRGDRRRARGWRRRREERLHVGARSCPRRSCTRPSRGSARPGSRPRTCLCPEVSRDREAVLVRHDLTVVARHRRGLAGRLGHLERRRACPSPRAGCRRRRGSGTRTRSCPRGDPASSRSTRRAPRSSGRRRASTSAKPLFGSAAKSPSACCSVTPSLSRKIVAWCSSWPLFVAVTVTAPAVTVAGTSL